MMRTRSRPRVHREPAPVRGGPGEEATSNEFERERLRDREAGEEDRGRELGAEGDVDWDSDTIPPPGTEGDAPEVVVTSESDVEEEVSEEEAETAAETESEAEVDEAAEGEEEGEEVEAEEAGAEEAAEAGGALEEAAAEAAPVEGPGVEVAPVVPQPAMQGPEQVAPESGSDAFVGDLYGAYSGYTPDQHAAMSEVALGNLDGVLASGQQDVDAHAESLCGQIDAAIEGKVGMLWSSFETAAANLTTGFTTARANVEGFAATALANIEESAAAAVGRIDAAETTQLGLLDQGFEAEITRLGTIADGAVASFTSSFDSQVQAIRDVGEARAQEALATGQSRAGAYRARGGSGIDGERNQARADAALRVAQDYAVGLREKANEIANEVAQGSANIPSTVSQLTDPVVEQLNTARADAETGLTDAATSAREQVETQRQTAVEAMEDTREQALGTLDSQEQASLEDLRGLACTFEENIRNAGESLKEQVRTAAADLGAEYAEAAAAIQAAVAAGDMPDGDDVQAACEELLAEFEAQKATHLADLDNSVQTGLAELDTELGNACDGLQQAATTAVEQADCLATELGNGLLEGAEGFATSLDELSTQIETNLGEMVTGAVDGARACVDDTATGLQEQEQSVVTELGTVVTNVNGSLGEAMAKLPSDIETEAENAASKIQPWWKKAIAAVVSIVVAIVVVVAVAAFCVATLGTGAIVAGIIAGAVAGVAATFASDATMSLLTWSNQFSSWETYVAAGLTGAVMGGVGAWVGPMVASASTGVKIAAGTGMSFLGSSVDQVLDITLFGEDWNWGEWFLGGAVGAVLGGLATRFVPASLGDRMRSSLFSRGGGNTWNNFQRAFAQVPGLSGSTPTQRSLIYQMVSRELGDVPQDLAEKAAGILDVAPDTDKAPVDPDQYQGDGSRVEIPDIAVPSF